VRDIAPRVWARAPEARVVIVGPEPPEALRASASERVIVTGVVDDVTPWLDRAAVVAVPLRLGSGMRVKVLEALAAGKAVVATGRAVEGLDVTDGEQVRIADDDDAFATAIAELLDSAPARARLAARARRWAIGSFDREHHADAYDALYDSLDARSGGRASAATGARQATDADIERALDWRFLLPRPASGRFDHLVVPHPSPEIVRAIEHHGVAREVSAALPDDGSASAVVLLPGVAVKPAALAAALRADGALYVEVDRRLPAQRRWSPRRLARALRTAGISVRGIYAVDRAGLASRRYLAVDDPAPMRWFLRDAYRPVTATQWAAGVVKAALLRAAPHGRLLQPTLRTFVVVASASDATPLALDAISPAAIPVPSHTPLALLGEGGDRVVALPFAPGASHPTAVVKVPRRAAFRARTENEQARMAELRASLPADLARAIPEPVGLVHDGDRWAATERALSGRTLLASSGRWGTSWRRRVADLHLAGDWLAAFHSATTVEHRQWSSHETATWSDALFERYGAAYGLEPAEQRLQSLAREYAASLEGLALPVVWAHRDYAVWNLARNRNRLAILDWEGARIGPPLCDMLHLATTWHMVVRRSSVAEPEAESFRRLFVEIDPRDRVAAAAADAIRRYLRRLALDERLVPMLALHHRLELAVRHAEQLTDQGRPVDRPRAGNAWVSAVRLLTEHAERLFAMRR
jgi:aminoglycoside phosphotransferase (APT) family kinase protein